MALAPTRRGQDGPLNQEGQGQPFNEALVFQFFPPESGDGRHSQVSPGYGPRHSPQGIPVTAVQHRAQEAVLKGVGMARKA